ncbi:poly(U)-specific 3'-to-5' RNA exonuclease [Coemansia sp. Benny D115]|nr:poly(U)-specific 3'-to-5' RNA exonuclease [Coemansia sp. Benny D115]
MALRLVDYPSSDEDSSSDGSSNAGRDYCSSDDGRSKQTNAADAVNTALPRHGSEDGHQRRFRGAEKYDDAGHALGGWAGHICLSVQWNARLEGLAARCIEEIRSVGAAAGVGRDAVQRIASPHISLSRPFFVAEHQIARTVEEVRRALHGQTGLAVAYSAASVYVNERGDRCFVGVDVGAGGELVAELVARVDAVLAGMGKRRFFRRPRFHLSLVAVDLGPVADVPGFARAVETRLGQMVQEIRRLPASRIDAVDCFFGGRQHPVALGH